MSYNKVQKDRIKDFFKKYHIPLLNYIIFDPDLDLSIFQFDRNIKLKIDQTPQPTLLKAKSVGIEQFGNAWIPSHGNFHVTKEDLDNYFQEPQNHRKHIFYGLLEVDDEYLWKNRNHIDWDKFSFNKHYLWTKKRIRLFDNYLNFKHLSYNCNLEIDKDILNEYVDEWDWNGLSGNPAISIKSLLNDFESKIIWQSETDSIFDFHHGISVVNDFYQGNKFYKYGARLDQKLKHEPSKEIKLNFEDNFKPSLSTNPNIYWDYNTFEKFKDKVSFWQIARYSPFDKQILEKYSDLLNENKKYKRIYKRYGDGTDSYLEYRNGWENLALNKNFALNGSLLSFLKKIKTNVIRYDGRARTGFTKKTIEESVLSILKASQVDIDFYDLVTWKYPLPDDAFYGFSRYGGGYDAQIFDVLNRGLYKNIISPALYSNNDLIDLFFEVCLKREERFYHQFYKKT